MPNYQDTLLGYLAAARRDVFAQAEVLCTLSLGWVLGASPEAARAFGEITGAGGVDEWRTEWVDDRSGTRHSTSAGHEPADVARTGDPAVGEARPLVGRVDFAGYHHGEPVVFVEAKIGAPVDVAQLAGYQARGQQVALLVPSARLRAATAHIDAAEVQAVTVVSWEDILAGLEMVVKAGPAVGGLTQLCGLYRQVQARPPVYEFTTKDLADPARRYHDICAVVDDVTSAVVKTVNAKKHYPIHHKPGRTDPRRYFEIDAENDSSWLAVIAPISRHAIVGSVLALSATTSSRSHWLPVWQAAGLGVHEDPVVPCVALPFHADTAVNTVVDRAVDRIVELINLGR